jgi:hypothetical protein
MDRLIKSGDMAQSIVWGIKASLVAYVRSLADGRIDVSGGAEERAGGLFAFPVVGAEDREVRCRGSVVLRGHGALLDVAIVDPWIDPSAGTLSIAAQWTEPPGERLVIARMPVAPRSDGWTASPVLLTADGALTLGALQYYEGQQVDDVALEPPLP